MERVLFAVSGPDDGFHTALRRRGWHLIRYAPVYNDANVLRWRVPFTSAADEREYSGFYQAFGDNRLRKVLRAILTAPRTHDSLLTTCKNETRLARILAYLEEGGFIELIDDVWMKGPESRHIHDIGKTMEWYVAEWFRRELHAPARHGVMLKEVRRGGDLDVIAFVNDICVFVECKTGKPDKISETDIRLFLQRAHDFGPEIAVLLIDTDTPISKPIRLVAEVISELDWLENHPEAAEVPADVRQSARAAEVPFGYQELYHCARNVYLTGVPKSIDASLSAVLRYYYSFVRHQLYFGIPREWDFVAGTIHQPVSNHSA